MPALYTLQVYAQKNYHGLTETFRWGSNSNFMSLEADHKVPRMYGVDHGSSLDLAGICIGEGKVYPSVSLIEDLFALPVGSTIGLETFNPGEVKRLTYKIGSRRFGLSKGGKFYWQEIINICRLHGLNIAYLDDFKVYREYVAKVFEEQRYKEEVERYRKEETEPDREKLREIKEAAYRANVEGRFIFEVKREEEFVKKIAKYKPERVIIGRAHGDCLMAGGELLDKYGVCVSDYLKEEVERNMWGSDWAAVYLLSGRIPGQVSVLTDSPYDPSILLDRELLLRKQRVLVEGRVTAFTDRPPDFVGTWDLECPLRGYFEMYVNGQAEGEPFSGVIEDCLGTADFEGEIDDNWTQFLKSYNEGQRAKESVGSQIPILYEGYLKDGVFRGDYSYHNEVWGDVESKFVLCRGLNLADIRMGLDG